MRAFNYLILVSFFINTGTVYGQDPHFSQYFASPLSLNPANTGFIDGRYRVATNYRQQWWNVGEAYSTATISADFNLYSDNPTKTDKFGIGAMAIREESFDGMLNSTYISLSTAYHKNLADDSKHILGVGFQISYCNKILDYSRLTFASQFTGKGFDPSIPTEITISSNTANFMDINTGIIYYSLRDWGNYYAGISVYHLNNPIESVFSSSGSPLKIRKTLHVGGTSMVNDNINLMYSALYMKQGNIQDRLIGSAVEFHTSSSVRLHLGLWYRIEDAIIPYVGVDLNNVSIGFNYDISNHEIATYRPKTVEFSLILRKLPINKLALCPRF